MRLVFGRKFTRRFIAFLISSLILSSCLQVFIYAEGIEDPLGKTIISAGNESEVSAPALGDVIEGDEFTPAEITAEDAEYKAGDIITFGKVPDFSDYMQGGDAVTPAAAHPGGSVNPEGYNLGATGIDLTWQIVDVVDGNKVILLATDVISTIWNITNFAVGRNNDVDFWAVSNMRKFLNGGKHHFLFSPDVYWVGDFDGYYVDHKGGIYGKAFSPAEQQLLLDYNYEGADGLNGTTNKVVVPSVTELQKWRKHEGVDMKAKLVGSDNIRRWYTRTPSETHPNSNMFLVDTMGFISESAYNGEDGYQANLGPRPVIMLPLSYFPGGVYVPDPGEIEDPYEPVVELGWAQEYDWDNLAVDGSGNRMINDPRIVIFDDFEDYNGVSSTHMKSGWDQQSPRRWIGGAPLDSDNAFSGDYGMRFDVSQNSTSEQGGNIQMWVDSRALRGERMNDEIMTGMSNYTPSNPEGLPLSPGVNPQEGGYEELFARTMVKYADNFNFNVSSHNGIGFFGGYGNRPDCGGSIPPYPEGTPPGGHPGSQAGYRSNGFDRFMAEVEPEMGNLNIYFYGAEQCGVTGNHMYPTGEVVPSTGRDNERPVNRTDGVDGFKARPNFRPETGKWMSMELQVKLNTVIKDGTSAGPNDWWNPNDTGPQPVPADAEILEDGIIRVWMDGVLVLEYTDVVFRYTNSMIIDNFSISKYFGRYNFPDTSMWYDNVVVSTEYVGPVNTSGEVADRLTISYDPNGGTGTIQRGIVDPGENYVISNNTFVNEGFEFNGWNTDANGNGTAYANGTTINDIQSDIILYAQWKPASGTIGSEVEFGTFGGNLMKWIVMGYDDDSYTLLNKYALENRQFHPWTTSTEVYWVGSPLESYLNGSFFSSNFSTEEKTAMLSYDGRENNFVTIPSGPEILGWWGGTPSSRGIEGRLVTFPDGTGSDGAAYATWWFRVEPFMRAQDSNSLNDNTVETRWNYDGQFAPAQIHGNAAIRPLIKVDRAYFDGAPQYNIVYNANNGSGTMPSDSVEQGADYIVRANAFTRIGFTFTGWNTAADRSGISYTAGDTISNMQSNLTLFAQWMENEALPSDTVRFGTFDGEPIEWIYAASDNDTYTLISKYILERRQFHSDNGDRANWIGTDIYNYLNSEFYTNYFSTAEKNAIQSYTGASGYYIHLATKAEAEAWFTTDTARVGYMRPGVLTPYPVSWHTSSIALDATDGSGAPRSWCHWTVDNAAWGMQYAGSLGPPNNANTNNDGQGGNANLGSGVGVDVNFNNGVRPVVKVSKDYFTADTTAPVLTLPADMTIEAAGPDGAAATFTATATDLVDGDVAVICTPASGSTFSLGTTTVTCTASDEAGNTASESFTVTVVDTTAPALILPADMTIEAAGPDGAAATFTATATDLVDGDVAVICAPLSGSTFAPGTTTVNCTATDAAGNTALGSFTVTVEYDFKGFFQPIGMNGVVNSANAGSAIPVKFSLGGNMGLNIFKTGYPKVYAYDVGSKTATAPIELTVTAGNSSLSYDSSSGQYIYVWKTDKDWAGLGKKLVIEFNDGRQVEAFFLLK